MDGLSQSAVCAEHPMAHYVEVTLLESFNARMGVVGQGFDAAGGGEASDSAEGWLLYTGNGDLRHAGGSLFHAGNFSDWEGMPQKNAIEQGDVVGLLLDLGQRTLSVYLNGARRGVMVAPGMKNNRGEAVAPLAGPLRWAVDVSYGASVRIAAAMLPLPPLHFSVAGPDVALTKKGTRATSSSSSSIPTRSFPAFLLFLPSLS
jgi:hypothetical protein